MRHRSAASNTASQREPLQADLQAGLLGELYWFTLVVEAGSFSAAAERTGVAKSSLSRRIAQLENRLEIQLINRSTRTFAVTTVGKQVYRHALDMLEAANAAQDRAQEAREIPGGLIRIGVPDVLSGWLLHRLAAFQASYPRVSYALVSQDGLADLRQPQLNLSLIIGQPPLDGADLVVRPLAPLARVVVGSPALLARLGHPARLDEIPDNLHLRLAGPGDPGDDRGPRFSASNLQTLREAARAGLGLAVLPRCTCADELAAGLLAEACPEEPLEAVTLHAVTPSYRGITQTVRALLGQLKADLGGAAD